MIEEKELGPLSFIPIAARKPWGGCSLAKGLGKRFTEIRDDGKEHPIPENELIGESWELADMGAQDSVVCDGPLAGETIGGIMKEYGENIVGPEVMRRYGARFPLLIKYLDIEDKLSIQVHPDDEFAGKNFGSLGKAEMWYIIDAKPDARMYLGFNRDLTPEEFRDACKSGTADRLLNVIHPKNGDAIFIRPGTVHAADGGIVLCEIQESSDLTFRLYDWGRELNPATARKMQLEEALELIDFKKYDGSGFRAADAPSTENSRKCILRCPQFTISHLTLFDSMKIGDERPEGFVVYNCLKGKVSLRYDGPSGKTGCKMVQGDTVLVPACCTGYELIPSEEGSELLESCSGI